MLNVEIKLNFQALVAEENSLVQFEILSTDVCMACKVEWETSKKIVRNKFHLNFIKGEHWG